jgi:glycogen operon protein
MELFQNSASSLPTRLQRLSVESARETAESLLPSFDEYVGEVTETGVVRRGVPQPLGAREFEGGINFALVSREASRVQLELFAHAEDAQPSKVIGLDPVRNRTGDVWHIWIEALRPGQLYSYRITPSGAGQTPAADATAKLDPYATAICRLGTDTAPKCVVTRCDFDWKDDIAPRTPWSKTVIYEAHVRGFTVDPSSEVAYPGTFRGLTQKIPYLQDLGVTTLELLPVQEFIAERCSARDPVTGHALRNYWGYDDPLAALAPNGTYSSRGDSGEQVTEFKEMVRDLHRAGMELIVDITFPRSTGTVPPATRQYIIDALRYWVTVMHVDGFRLDLASLLGRDTCGCLICNRQLLEEIAADPILRHTKLVTAGWHTAGAFGMDSFCERRWAEWNGRYRDDVRRFWRGDAGLLGAFASRICGSADLYGRSGKGPEISVNLVTCHDGLTLNDLVSYQSKHNQCNGARPGEEAGEEFSANYGVEGPATDPGIEALRKRQIKNFLLTLFVSRGVPMLLGGDEFRRTQLGNSNAYCQDNETSWYNWHHLQHDADTHDFVKRIIALRREHPVLSREAFYTAADIRWFSPSLGTPHWADPRQKTLGCLIRDDGQNPLYLMFNAEETPMSLRIPFAPRGQQWCLEIDTATDLPVSGAGPIVPGGSTHTLAPRSSAILTATHHPSAGAQIPARREGFRPGGCDPSIEDCAQAMGGDDPDVAYAAAMLWYQGYPDVPDSSKPE